jgi:olfactory receptor
MKELTFTVGTEIPHFFCDLSQVLKVASSDTFIDIVCLYVSVVLMVVFPVSGIFFSYSQIVSSLLQMSSIASK